MSSETPRIPPEEYGRRFERLRAEMQAERMDALLLSTGMNLAYFTGYPSPARNVARPFFALLPLRGDPVFFTHTGHAFEAVRFSWIRDVREYTAMSQAPVELLRQALSERGLIGGTVGMELGYEQTLDISQLEFRRLEGALAPTCLVDASAILWRLRMIKSANEIACLRRACRTTAEAYEATFASARAGMPESEIYTTMHRLLDRPDTGGVFLVITSGEGNYDLVTKPPEARPVRRGDMVWMDAGCTIGGYWSDYSRAAVIGRPSDEQKHAQEAIRGLTREAVSRIRPGVPASAIARFCLERFEQLDFDVTSYIGKLAGRIGHGIGLNLTEPPHLGLHDDTPFAPGMVVSVEPGVATRYGTFHIEENVVVTDDGCEILSGASRDLTVIGG